MSMEPLIVVVSVFGVGIALSAQLRSGHRRLDERLNPIDKRMGGIDSRVTSIDTELSGLGKEVAHLSGLVEGLREAIAHNRAA